MNIPEFYERFQESGQRFTTDTRKLQGGHIYFALKGANFDGNAFARDALKKGASCAVVDDPGLDGVPDCILVDDVLVFMQQLARHHRDRFAIPVIAIGGSNGKTTTKELMLSILGQAKKVHGTKGNLNNLIGVPMTLLEMPPETEIAVIEIGTNTFGEIGALCAIVNPDYGLITNIGKEHLEGFGSLEGVAKEESELYLHLKKTGGLAFVSRDDEWLMRMASRVGRTYTYGLHRDADFNVTKVRTMPDIRLEIDGIAIQSRLFGDYNLSNITAAAAVGHYFGIATDAIARGIEAYIPSNNRSEIRELNGVHVIMDSYNANPTSMEAAIGSFAELQADRKLVILGDMFELGEQAEAEHRQITQLVSDLRLDDAVLIGEYFGRQAASIGKKGYPTVDEAIADLQNRDLRGSWILIKGSRGMKLEKVLELWREDPKA